MSFLARFRHADAVALPPEIASLVAQGHSYPMLAEAAARARRCGMDAATTLLNEGMMSEELFYRSLARAAGTRFLDSEFTLDHSIDHHKVLKSNACRLAAGQGSQVVAAPRGQAIARLLDASRGLAETPTITTPSRLRTAVYVQHAAAIADAASDDLARRRPEWSCRPGAQPVDLLLAGLAAVLAIALTNSATWVGLVMLAVVQVVLLAMLSLRLAAAAVPASIDARPEDVLLPDDPLPTYTVLVALYREAKVVPRLIHGLAKLDYPPAKLQIVFLIEADDATTAAAFAAAPTPARFEVLVVPPGSPRTKPRALNAALPIVRGSFSSSMMPKMPSNRLSCGLRLTVSHACPARRPAYRAAWSSTT